MQKHLVEKMNKQTIIRNALPRQAPPIVNIEAAIIAVGLH